MPAGFEPVDGVPEDPALSELFEPLSVGVLLFAPLSLELDDELLLSLLPESVVVFFGVLL